MTPALNGILAGIVAAGTLAALAIGEELPQPEIATVSGPARVIDGDTIVVSGVRVRLWGIDAPEATQTCLDASGRSWACGEAATAYLRSVLGAAPGECRRKDTDRYGRMVATCEWAGIDLGLGMVGAGLAVDYPRYSGGHYAEQEADARNARRGIWAGTFEMPWEWRRLHPQR